MSSSQARLLTITARLNHNEYESQRIATQKLELSTLSNEAMIEYQNSLNSKILIYNNFDATGTKTQNQLTAGALYTYQPSKNQYLLVNATNQVLVNPDDANNFEETSNMIDFLDKYGVFDNYNKEYAQYVVDMEKYNSEIGPYNEKFAEYKVAEDKYYLDMDVYNTNQERFEEDLEEYPEAVRLANIADVFANAIGSSESAEKSTCYGLALTGYTPCYLHLLNMMLDYDGGDVLKKQTYKASCDTAGNKNTTECTFQTNGDAGGTFDESGTHEIMKDVSTALNLQRKDKSYFSICDGVEYGTTSSNLIKDAIDAGRKPTALEILQSDFVYNPDKTGEERYNELKTLKQKTIDMYYILLHKNDFKNGDDKKIEITAEDMKNMLIGFTEYDMRNLLKAPIKPTKEFLNLYPGPEPEKPVMPEIYVNDKEKAQWYINLWTRMNGNDDCPIVQTEDNSKALDDYFIVNNLANLKAVKNPNSVNYATLDRNLIQNEEWLQNSLSQGTLIMQKLEADEVNPGRVTNWTGAIYSNISEFTIKDNEKAIARAEAKYQAVMDDIESKDNKFQTKMKKLDTEHNALKTEYESLKNVVTKNIERSFKSFA